MYATISNYHTILEQQSWKERVSQNNACIINVGLCGNLANLPVKIRESLCQFCPHGVRTKLQLTESLWWRPQSTVFWIDHKELCGVFRIATKRFVVFWIGHKALCGVLNRPQSALWCKKSEKPNYFRKSLWDMCESTSHPVFKVKSQKRTPQSALWRFQ